MKPSSPAALDGEDQPGDAGDTRDDTPPQLEEPRYRDEFIYFCGQDCQQPYQTDPFTSCLAARHSFGR